MTQAERNDQCLTKGGIVTEEGRAGGEAPKIVRAELDDATAQAAFAAQLLKEAAERALGQVPMDQPGAPGEAPNNSFDPFQYLIAHSAMAADANNFTITYTRQAIGPADPNTPGTEGRYHHHNVQVCINLEVFKFCYDEGWGFG
jgi:hypothetical protein